MYLQHRHLQLCFLFCHLDFDLSTIGFASHSIDFLLHSTAKIDYTSCNRFGNLVLLLTKTHVLSMVKEIPILFQIFGPFQSRYLDFHLSPRGTNYHFQFFDPGCYLAHLQLHCFGHHLLVHQLYLRYPFLIYRYEYRLSKCRSS